MTLPADLREDAPVTVTMTAGQWQTVAAKIHGLRAPQTARQRVVTGRNTRLLGANLAQPVVTARWKKPAVIAGSAVTGTAVLFVGGLAFAGTATGHLVWTLLGLLVLIAAGIGVYRLFSGATEHCPRCPGVQR